MTKDELNAMMTTLTNRLRDTYPDIKHNLDGFKDVANIRVRLQGNHTYDSRGSVSVQENRIYRSGETPPWSRVNQDIADSFTDRCKSFVTTPEHVEAHALVFPHPLDFSAGRAALTL